MFTIGRRGGIVPEKGGSWRVSPGAAARTRGAAIRAANLERSVLVRLEPRGVGPVGSGAARGVGATENSWPTKIARFPRPGCPRFRADEHHAPRPVGRGRAAGRSAVVSRGGHLRWDQGLGL